MPEPALGRGLRHTTRRSGARQPRNTERDQVGSDVRHLVPQLVRRAPHHQPVAPGDRTRALDVGTPLRDLEVEAPVHLEHEDRPVGQVPLAVGPALPAGTVEPWPLPGRWDESEPPTHPAYVDLRHRLCAPGDVRHGAPEPTCPAEGLQGVDPGEKPLRRGESLLHGSGQDSMRSAERRVVAGPQQDRRLDLSTGKAGPRRAQELERSPAPEEPHSRDRLEGQLVVHEHRDRRSRPPGEAGRLGRRQSAHHAARAGVEHRDPAPLLPRQHASRGADHPRGVHDPPARPHLVAHAFPLQSERGQLAPGQDAALGGRELVEHVHPSRVRPRPSALQGLSTAPGASDESCA